MKWEELGKSIVAYGENGAFLINKSRVYFYIKYITKNKIINFQRQKRLYVAKAICEKSVFWEDEKEVEDEKETI